MNNIKKFLLVLSLLSPVGADENGIEGFIYCENSENPQGLLLARQALESVESIDSSLHVKSEISMKNGKLSDHRYELRSVSLAETAIQLEKEGCIKLESR
jgi:hypothetical protein